ncbi:MAG: zinc ribbon domain-containing protein [Planctomycetota bacterium]
MPTYEYQCLKCHVLFTVQQSFAEHDERKRVKCPKCKGTKVERVFGSTFVKTSKKS